MTVVEDDSKPMTNAKSVQISVDDFECLPSYMKSLASWEVRRQFYDDYDVNYML